MIKLKVNKLLEDKNKTMYWLSKQTGISSNNIGKLFHNETKSISFETLEKIYTVLGCKSFDEIFEHLPESEEDKQ